MKIRVLTFCFRKLPNYFNIWLKSAAMNPEIDFLVVTVDKTECELPNNVVIKYKTFDEVMDKVRSSFSCPVDIRDPYKFCDLRPMFGYIFPEWFEGYDFWGGCDLDIVFGSIKTFITEGVLQKYDKIFTRDHFYLYRNTDDVNKRFMLPIRGKEDFYQQVLGDHLLYCFGERKPWGMYFLYLNNRFTMFDAPYVADIYHKKKAFHVNVEGEKIVGQVFLWNNGKLMMEYVTQDGKLREKEYMYVHLQKRPMKRLENTSKCIAIVPNSFLPFDGKMTKKFVLNYSKEPLVYDEYLRQVIRRFKNPANEIFYQR